METYTLTPKEINTELHNKLLDNYVIREITVYCNEIIDINEINKIKQYSKIPLTYGFQLIDYFDNIIYFDNQITIKCYHLMDPCIKKTGYLDCRDLNVKYYEIKIEKPEILLEKIDNDTMEYDDIDEENDITICSNYFNDFEEIITFYISVSGMTYEQTKEYLLKHPDDYILNNINDKTKEKLIFVGKSNTKSIINQFSTILECNQNDIIMM